VYVVAPAAVSGFELESIMRDAQYPSRTTGLRDEDGNPLYSNSAQGLDPMRKRGRLRLRRIFNLLVHGAQAERRDVPGECEQRCPVNDAAERARHRFVILKQREHAQEIGTFEIAAEATSGTFELPIPVGQPATTFTVTARVGSSEATTTLTITSPVVVDVVSVDAVPNPVAPGATRSLGGPRAANWTCRFLPINRPSISR
jgi:hypothetical protein